MLNIEKYKWPSAFTGRVCDEYHSARFHRGEFGMNIIFCLFLAKRVKAPKLIAQRHAANLAPVEESQRIHTSAPEVTSRNNLDDLDGSRRQYLEPHWA